MLFCPALLPAPGKSFPNASSQRNPVWGKLPPQAQFKSGEIKASENRDPEWKLLAISNRSAQHGEISFCRHSEARKWS